MHNIYFDIDGVLNTTPARGNLGFGADQDKIDRLLRIPGKKTCISYWRNNHAHEVKLPFEFEFAPKGEKRNCVKDADLIIDDQKNLYDESSPVYQIDGRVGITDQDVDNILTLLSNRKPKPKMAEAKKCGGCASGASAKQVQNKSLEQHYIDVVKTKSDINEHLMTLMALVKENPRIVEMGTRYAQSTTAFLYGKPKLLHTYDLRKSSQAENLKRYVDDKECDYQCIVGDSTEVNIVECDLLFLDTDPHTAERVYAELSKHHKKVKNYIVFHDTEIFGEKYGDQPGVLPAIRRFAKENPEWFTYKHYSNNNGLTILSKLDKDRPPELPSLLKQAYNFGKAKIKLTLSGEGYLPEEKANERHAICTSNGGTCPLNMRKIDTDQCTKCGCPLKETPDGRKGKTYYPTESCPFGLWGPVYKDDVVNPKEEIVELTSEDETSN